MRQSTFQLFCILFVVLIFLGSPLSDLEGSAQDGPAKTRDEVSSQGSMAGVDLQRTRVYRSQPVAEPKTVLWKTGKLFESYSSFPAIITLEGLPGRFAMGTSMATSMTSGHGSTDPIIASGTIYFSLYINDGYLFVQDAKSGTDKWRFRLKGHTVSDSAVAGDAVYFGSSNGIFYALATSSGKELWNSRLKTPQTSSDSPIISNGIVYFRSIEGGFEWTARPYGRIHALDARTGEEKWVFKIRGTLSSPALASKTLFAGDSEGNLHALDTETGQAKWKFRAGSGVTSPAIMNGSVYFHDYDGNLHAVETQTGKEKWKTSKGPKVAATLALSDGVIFYAGRENSLYAVHASDGAQKWAYKTEKQCRPPVIAGGLVYFSCYDGFLYAVDVYAGIEKWKLKSSGTVPSSPVIDGGVIYFLNADGHMYALR